MRRSVGVLGLIVGVTSVGCGGGSDDEAGGATVPVPKIRTEYGRITYTRDG